MRRRRLGRGGDRRRLRVGPRRRAQIESHLKLRGTTGWARDRRGPRRRALRALCRAPAARVGRGARDSAVWIPRELDYAAVPGLSTEMVERLVGVAARNARPGVAHPRRDPRGAVGRLRRRQPPRCGMIEALERAAGRPVSRETFALLEAYVERLKAANREPESGRRLDPRRHLGAAHPRFGAARAFRAARRRVVGRHRLGRRPARASSSPP